MGETLGCSVRLWGLPYKVAPVVEHRGVELIFHLTHAAVQSPY